ncbi:MAG: hypothetical protein LUG23_00230 [Oscillospiraceae bacterium]|nr:hypothetical protein [Oscillospiraceae bacterium]
MSKPRLAEILGVEVDEVFTIKGETNKECSVDNCGVFYINGACESGDIYDLMYIINNPEVIVRKPKSRWTKQDVEDAKAMIRLFRNIAYIQRSGDKLLFEQQLGDLDVTVTIPTNNPWLPSLRVGETVGLREILSAEPVE